MLAKTCKNMMVEEDLNFKMFVGTVWEGYKNMASVPSHTIVSHKMYIKGKCQDVGKDKGRFSFCL